MSQIFQETEWDQDLPKTKTSFQFKTNHKQKKEKLGKKSLDNIKKFDHEPGRYVKLYSDNNPNGTNTADSPRKRPHNNKTVMPGNKKESNEEHEIPSKKRKTTKNDVALHKIQTQNKANKVNNIDREKSKLLNKKGKEKKNDAVDSSPISSFSAMKNNLQDKLKGSRFRYINEQLYTSTGEKAVKLFKDDPTAFNAYHEGYRLQVESWPMNPLDKIIKSFKKIPKDYIVADFGCGDARLSRSIPNKVYSLDLVAQDNEVIECDMANTFLHSDSVNVAVYCLSLMGTNLVDFLLEANRVLKVNGLLKIAEVSSRFDSQILKSFSDVIKNCGFILTNQDLTDKLFYFFNYKKVKSVNKSNCANIPALTLKPCLYKKR